MLLLQTWRDIALRALHSSWVSMVYKLGTQDLTMCSINLPGAFAEYCAYPAGKVFKIHNLSPVDATLLEPASCAAHGLDKISPKYVRSGSYMVPG